MEPEETPRPNRLHFALLLLLSFVAFPVGYPDFTFAFHDADEVGPRMLARVAKHTGLSPSDI